MCFKNRTVCLELCGEVAGYNIFLQPAIMMLELEGGQVWFFHENAMIHACISLLMFCHKPQTCEQKQHFLCVFLSIWHARFCTNNAVLRALNSLAIFDHLCP